MLTEDPVSQNAIMPSHDLALYPNLTQLCRSNEVQEWNSSYPEKE
jgi:hypothetical protein